MNPQKICTSNDRIRQLLDETGITQTEFCKRTRIQKSALSNYLKGDRTPRQDQLTKIADAFNVSAAWLMGYDIPQRLDSDMFVMDMTEPGKEHLTLYGPCDRIQIYAQLLDFADRCTIDQIHVAMDTLKSLSKLNKKED